MHRIHRTLAALLLATAPLVAAGYAIYKVEMPDGSILFTDTPPPGAKILEERQTKSNPRPVPPRPATAGSVGSAGVSPVPVLPSRGSAVSPSAPTEIKLNIESVTAEISAAERELTVARRKLELGREPQPGERLGTVKGGSRLTPEYESRIADLEREVSQAEARVKRAYDARNMLR
jgi:hypothetical protein